jgi:hypothetical protein
MRDAGLRTSGMGLASGMIFSEMSFIRGILSMGSLCGRVMKGDMGRMERGGAGLWGAGARRGRRREGGRRRMGRGRIGCKFLEWFFLEGLGIFFVGFLRGRSGVECLSFFWEGVFSEF